MNAISPRGALCELEGSRRQLAEWLGEPISGFAYPYGDKDSSLCQLPKLVASAGYQYAVTLKRGAVSAASDVMSLQRDHVEGNWRVKDLSYFLGSRG